MNSFRNVVVLILGALASAGLQAHHSTRGIYQDREVELNGKVVEWRFINPHPYLIIEAEGDDGEVHEWDVSFGGAAVVHLTRQGYTAETFKPGDMVKVRGNPAMAAGVYGVLLEGDRHPTRPDGTPIVAGGSPF